MKANARRFYLCVKERGLGEENLRDILWSSFLNSLFQMTLSFHVQPDSFIQEMCIALVPVDTICSVKSKVFMVSRPVVTCHFCVYLEMSLT
jgi:hypothetical protein